MDIIIFKNNIDGIAMEISLQTLFHPKKWKLWRNFATESGTEISFLVWTNSKTDFETEYFCLKWSKLEKQI